MHETVQKVENLEQMCLSLHFSKKCRNCCTLMNSKQTVISFIAAKGVDFLSGGLIGFCTVSQFHQLQLHGQSTVMIKGFNLSGNN
jgi:hypothetical protein